MGQVRPSFAITGCAGRRDAQGGWRPRATPAVLVLSDPVRAAAADGPDGRGPGCPHVEGAGFRGPDLCFMTP